MRDDAAHASRRNRTLPSERLQSAANLKRIVATAEIRPHVDIHDMATHLPLPHFKMPTSSIELLTHCRSVDCREAESHLAGHSAATQQHRTCQRPSSTAAACRCSVYRNYAPHHCPQQLPQQKQPPPRPPGQCQLKPRTGFFVVQWNAC